MLLMTCCSLLYQCLYPPSPSQIIPPERPLTIDSGLSFHGTLWLLNILNCLFYQAQTLVDSSVTCQKFTELQAQTIVTHSSCRIMRNLKIPSLYGPALRKIIPCHTRTRKQRRNEMMDNRIGFQDDLPIQGLSNVLQK